MNEFEIVECWLRKAVDDLKSAKVLRSEDLLANSCYFAQQASEKALKAYLAQFDAEIPHSHNLSMLCKRCIIHDNVFLEILDDSSDLTDYATQTRYPGDDTVDEDETKEAIQKAENIYQFVQERIGAME
ncbi:MAG: HEPN domain-containing protein [Oscillospiraceae bacterium]|nr:HEPN domain-containing protein [Oscillospiraceae bacterium]